MANDENSYVRRWVVWNPNTPSETLKRLLNDKDTDVRCAAWEALQA
jgi:HEAT repeat protein